MKVLIFSDTHLTDKFDTELFDYIAKLVKSADQVVINGDFWDAYLTTFDKFVTSEWQKLFMLLKKKNTVYIFGNHDKQKFMDNRYNLFSDKQVSKYSFKSGNKIINVQHGHLLAPTHDRHLLFSNPNLVRWLYSILIFFRKNFPFFQKTLKWLHDEPINQRRLNRLNKYSTNNYKKDSFYVFGHSHIKYFDNKNNFISCSFAPEAEYSYYLIENGKVRLQ